MRITKTDIRILVDLYKSTDGLMPYIFYKRYKYSPSEVFKTASKFIEKDFLKSTNDKLHLTKLGREFIETKRFLFDKDRFGRIPEEFKVTRIGVNEPYMPNIKKFSIDKLNLQDKGDG